MISILSFRDYNIGHGVSCCPCHSQLASFLPRLLLVNKIWCAARIISLCPLLDGYSAPERVSPHLQCSRVESSSRFMPLALSLWNLWSISLLVKQLEPRGCSRERCSPWASPFYPTTPTMESLLLHNFRMNYPRASKD